MPTEASGGFGPDGGEGRGGEGSAEDWMPLRMRRARTSSVGSASASGADSSQHNASTSASDVDASQDSASYQQQQQAQQQQQHHHQQQGGVIMRMRSRGASITQAIPLETALKEEAAMKQQRTRLLSDGGEQGAPDDSSAASLVERASSNVSSLVASPIKARRAHSISSQPEGDGHEQEQAEAERFVGGGLDGNVMRFVKRSPVKGQDRDGKDVEQGLTTGAGLGPSARKLQNSSRGVSFAGQDEDEDDHHDEGGKPPAFRFGMKRSNTFTIGPGLVNSKGKGAGSGQGKWPGDDEGGRRVGGGKMGFPNPLRSTASMPPPSQGLQRGASDTSTASSWETDAEGRRARMRSRANSATFSIQEELHFDLDKDFDISSSHLVKLFAMMDKDGNGTLTYDELHESLLSMPGLQSIPREKLDELFERMDEDGNEGVSQEEFITMFQHIATKALARKGPGNLLEFSVYDYGPDQALCRRIYTKDPDCDDLDKTQVEYSLDEYFEEPIEDVKPGHVRWISITGVEPSVLIRLANRYRLHPLQVEDVLTYHKQRMKADKSGLALQLLVGRCVLTETSQGYPVIRKEQVSLFLLEKFNTVITIQQSPSDINRRLLARIMYAGSKIRLNGPRFLAYAVLDAIVDELFPLLRLIRKKLKALHSEVTSTRNNKRLGGALQHIIREANLLLLWLSPLSTVVARLSSELLGYEGRHPPGSLALTAEGAAAGMSDYDLKKHVDDLVDHVAALKEQTASMIDWAKSLNDEYLNNEQSRMNEVMYLLTMTTVVLLPAQFLTGVFGMNFTHFPLLDEAYGFGLFWVFTALAVGGILWFFKFKGWWTM